MEKTFAYYRKNFGFNVPVFEEEAIADLMLPYTGGKPQKRKATLALNMNGGGGLEIWQYTDREITRRKCEPGDLGLNVLKIKTTDVEKAYSDCKAKGLDIISEVQTRNGKASHFYVRDEEDNLVEVCTFNSWYKARPKGLYGGIAGCTIGVSNMEKSKDFYSKVLGFDTVVFKEEGKLPEFEENCTYTRVILERSEAYQGPFSPLLGTAQLELLKVNGREPQKLYEDRFWGDPGLIHLCFDVVGAEALKERCEDLGYPFTVDSANSFDMGEAAGRFSYIEDPDGALIEFVETHKVPIMKKFNWYLDLRKRDPKKPLPKYMINALGLNKVKD